MREVTNKNWAIDILDMRHEEADVVAAVIRGTSRVVLFTSDICCGRSYDGTVQLYDYKTALPVPIKIKDSECDHYFITGVRDGIRSAEQFRRMRKL